MNIIGGWFDAVRLCQSLAAVTITNIRCCFLSLIISWEDLLWQQERNKQQQTIASARGANITLCLWYFIHASMHTFGVITLTKQKRLIPLSTCLTYSAWLKGSAHSIVGKLDHRISMLTGLNVKHPYGEYLQVVNYGIGGHYEPHFDHATVSWLSVLFYTLQTVNVLTVPELQFCCVLMFCLNFFASSHLPVLCSS